MSGENVRREEFISKNLGLVHACTRRFVGKGIEYDDLYSAGCVGIIKAYDGFDASRGIKFSTYAVPVILGEIRRLFRDGGTVKVSRSLKELSMKILKKREELALKLGKDPSIHDLAKSLDLADEQVAEAICAASPTVSLTGSFEEGNEKQIDVKCEENGLKLIDKIAIKDAITKLNDKDRVLIVMRYFLDKTQTETAKQLKMTQVQVSRREKKILGVLRECLEC